MNTPICKFVLNYAESENVRFHMPGHKGKGFLGVEQRDITEIEGADVLYKAKGIIRESEQNTEKLFGTAKTKFSTEGSSLSIRAMLYLAMLYGKEQNKSPVILAGRNAHHTFMTAAALLDLEVCWLFPKEWESMISCDITAVYLDKTLQEMPQKPIVVYVTSPDYLGNVLDIEELAKVCHRHNVLLLVDNAHGAYLQFLSTSRHPIALGADMCCDSAHKTLPVLTGGGYLHISRTAPKMFCEYVEKAFSLFASTSPSYLILQSLDAVNHYLFDGYTKKLEKFICLVEQLKKRLQEHGYVLTGNEPLKLTIIAKEYGYTGEQMAEFLLSKEIVCEFSDPDYVVLMFTPENSHESLQYLEDVLCSLFRKEKINSKPPAILLPQRVCSIREALFSVGEVKPVSECLGEVLASSSVSCPPAIPIVVCGERIDENALQCFAYYGVENCSVIEKK